MRSKFALLLVAATLGACTITPHDGYDGVGSTTAPLSIWGYHPYPNETITIETRMNNVWTPVTTVAPNANQILSYGTNFYKWSTSVVLNDQAWERSVIPGRRAVLRATSSAGASLMSVRSDVVRCYNEHPNDPEGFRDDCGSDGSPLIRIYTSDYCPVDTVNRYVGDPYFSETNTQLTTNSSITALEARFNLERTGHSSVSLVLGIGQTGITLPCVQDGTSMANAQVYFDEDKILTRYRCSTPLTNQIRCALPALRNGMQHQIRYSPAPYGDCSTAPRSGITVHVEPDPQRLNTAQASCNVTPPVTPPGTPRPDLRAELVTTTSWYQVQFRVRNLGSVAAPAGYQVQYCLDGFCGYVAGPALAANGTSQLFSPTDPRPPNGSGSMPMARNRRANADQLDNVLESNEGNNGTYQSNPNPL
jgi:hypothetical protein